MKIFINPGHCPGIDSGAVGNGLKECDVALKIGKRVEKYLKAAGFDVKLLQADTPTETFNEICDPANDWNADFFISIHCNSFASSSANGTESFCFSRGGTAEKLATAIHKRILKHIPELTDRGIKTANYAVLRKTKMPAVLVETAFISNAHDAKLLVEKEDEFARAIACGVTDYLQGGNPIPDVIDSPTCPTCGKKL